MQLISVSFSDILSIIFSLFLGNIRSSIHHYTVSTSTPTVLFNYHPLHGFPSPYQFISRRRSLSWDSSSTGPPALESLARGSNIYGSTTPSDADSSESSPEALISASEKEQERDKLMELSPELEDIVLTLRTLALGLRTSVQSVTQTLTTPR